MGLSNWTNNDIHNRPNIIERVIIHPKQISGSNQLRTCECLTRGKSNYRVLQTLNSQFTLNVSVILCFSFLSVSVIGSPMASSLLALFSCLFLSLLSLSSSLNLRRPIFSQSNDLDLFSSLNLDRPSLAADDIHDLLPRYGFPKGLLPNNVKSYTISDDGDFTVDLISSCYVKFSDQLVFYGKNIAGKLSYGSVKDVRGIQAKEAFLWLPITAMESDPSSATVVFSVGFVSKTLPASMFENVPSCSRNLNLQDS